MSPPAHPPRTITTTDPERAMAELSRENEALRAMMTAINAIEDRMPSAEDMQYVRAARLQSERASWFWQVVRTYFPWVVSIGGAIVSGAWWVASHITIKGP